MDRTIDNMVGKKMVEPFESKFFTGKNPAEVLKTCMSIYYEFMVGHPTDKLAESWELETQQVEDIIREINNVKSYGSKQ